MVTEEERNKALTNARASVNAKMHAKQSEMTENEEALFLVIEQHLGLNRKKCMDLLRDQRQKEFDRLVAEEYSRNLEAIKESHNGKTDYFKKLEVVAIPVSANGEQAILDWGFRFKDEVTGSKSPTIREIFRLICPVAPNAISINDREKFIQEVRSFYEGKTFEHKFDRLQVGWEPGKAREERYFTVKFILRVR